MNASHILSLHPAHRHDSLHEGVRLGFIVASTTWVWLALVDAASGRPFQTFATLGGIVLFTVVHYLLNTVWSDSPFCNPQRGTHTQSGLWPDIRCDHARSCDGADNERARAHSAWFGCLAGNLWRESHWNRYRIQARGAHASAREVFAQRGRRSLKQRARPAWVNRSGRGAAHE